MPFQGRGGFGASGCGGVEVGDPNDFVNGPRDREPGPVSSESFSRRNEPTRAPQPFFGTLRAASSHLLQLLETYRCIAMHRFEPALVVHSDAAIGLTGGNCSLVAARDASTPFFGTLLAIDTRATTKKGLSQDRPAISGAMCRMKLGRILNRTRGSVALWNGYSSSPRYLRARKSMCSLAPSLVRSTRVPSIEANS